MLRTLFVDFNSYFASVEQQINPLLRGKPVGVVPLMTDSTCCIAASYEAKRFGVKTGTNVAEARRLCPGIVFIEARHEIYVDFHLQAVAAVERIAPVRQVLSIDEMECELTGSWCQRDKAVAIAQAIKREIHTTVGECLGSSIGIAPNTLLGKLASDMHKPNGLTVIEQHELPHRLHMLKLQDIPGIGRRMLVRLQQSGIFSVAQLCAAPRDLLHTAWGGLAGSEIYDKLRGQWQAPLNAGHATRSLGHSHVLPPVLRNAAGAYSVLNRLTQKAAMRLRKQGYYATALSVGVRCGHRYQDDAHAAAGDGRGGGQRETRFDETQDTAFLLHVLECLWHSGLHQVREPKAVSVTLHGLVPAAQHTPSLFGTSLRAQLEAAARPIAPLSAKSPSPTAPPRCTQAAKPPTPSAPLRDRARLNAAMDRINKTYGKNFLYFASAHGALNEAPMRIAFNRIPDIETER